MRVVVDPPLGARDPDRLQQVLWNLLSNSVKFTPKDGQVQLRLERVDSHVEIVIVDSGEGISPEFLPYVFDRFSQADDPRYASNAGRVADRVAACRQRLGPRRDHRQRSSRQVEDRVDPRAGPMAEARGAGVREGALDDSAVDAGKGALDAARDRTRWVV